MRPIVQSWVASASLGQLAAGLASTHMEQMAKPHVLGEAHEGEKVLGVGTGASPPSTKGERVGPEPSCQLAPR